MLRRTLCSALACILSIAICAMPVAAHIMDTQILPEEAITVDPEQHKKDEAHKLYDIGTSVTVKTMGGVSIELDMSEPKAGEAVSFGITLEPDFVLRGMEIFAREERTPIEFDVIGCYRYSFVMPQSGVYIMVRSEDHRVVSRADAVARIWQLAGSPIVEGQLSFTDVSSDSSYYDAVCWAADVKLISEGELFRPNDPLLREELATLLYRYAADKLVPESEDSFVLEAIDAPFISQWAYDAVIWSVRLGILDIEAGISGYFRPQAGFRCCELDMSLKMLSDAIMAENAIAAEEAVAQAEPEKTDETADKELGFALPTISFG